MGRVDKFASRLRFYVNPNEFMSTEHMSPESGGDRQPGFTCADLPQRPRTGWKLITPFMYP